MDNNKGDASLDGSSLGPGREDTRYYLIGGSFRNKDNAEDFRNKLAEKGYDSEVLHEPDGLHKVTYQTCNSLKKAKAALEELEQEGINSWIYQPPEKE
jgi:cell division protein FtsN